jgi:diguanylate cyclase (GGDEF)-like protein
LSVLPILTVIVRSIDYDWHWRTMDSILFMTAALNAVGLAAVAIMAIMRGSQPAKLFLLGWSLPMLVAVARLLWAVDVIHVQSDLFDISFFLALIGEIIVSSAGIVLRVRQLRVERDAAHLRELALRELAETDALTGLLNRRSFLEQCMAGENPKRLILIDVDHFKDVNDRYGHLTGDEVLTELADCLRRTIPGEAIIGRLGGEEFGIALRADLAPTLPQLIRKRVADTRFPHGLKLTVSVGYALGQIADDLSWKAIYSAADQALIAAKHGGRNRVHRRSVPIAA